MQTSKWLSYRALLDVEEMGALLGALKPFSIYNVSQVIDSGKERISHDLFLSKYRDYIDSLKRGIRPLEQEFKPYFSTAFSRVSEAFYAMEVKEGKWIVKAQKPAVQLSVHHFSFSREKSTFHSMIHSKEGVSWGLQFAFPQVYSNSIDNDVIEVYKDDGFPNTQLFKSLAHWMRRQTAPARFKIEGRVIYGTFRLGKKCRDWIDRHPQLKSIALSPCI